MEVTAAAKRPSSVNEYVGPGCCLVGNINIASNSTVSAASIDLKDAEAETTVAVTPAEYISNKNPGRFVNRRWGNPQGVGVIVT